MSDLRADVDRIRNLMNLGVMTWTEGSNEIRRLYGFPPLPKPEGKGVVVPGYMEGP